MRHDDFTPDTQKELEFWWYGINYAGLETKYEDEQGFDPHLEADHKVCKDELWHVNNERDKLRKRVKQLEDALLTYKTGFDSIGEITKARDLAEDVIAQRAKDDRRKDLPF